jgi:hypothetical protein
MASSRISGLTVAYTAIGGLVLWSGVKGTTLSAAFRSVLAGQPPSGNTEPVGSGLTLEQGAAGGGSAGSAAPGDTSAHGGSAAANQAIARLLAAPYGWSTGTQWEDLVSLWNRESGWSATALNPSSGAYGIAQFLDSTWATVGAGKTSSASGQIAAGLAYIRQRYGSPAAAWAHESADGWY